MSDLRKKLVDILFEDDVDEEELQEEVKEEKKIVVEKEDSAIRAKDILYRKPNTSAFINLNEEINKTTDEVKKEEYELSTQISPIFGIINEKKETVVNKNVDESLTNRPLDSHLDIITSPIYGYGGNNNQYDDNEEIEEEINTTVDDDNDDLHHLFDFDEPIKQEYDNQEMDLNTEEISLFRLFGDDK